MSIENLKKILEIERDDKATDWCIEKGVYNKEHFAYQAGHEAATNRLLPLIQKAVEMAEFYGDRKNWSSIDYKSDCKDLITFNDLGVKSYNEKPDYAVASGGRRAREFLLSLSETTESVSEFTKLTEIKKEGL